MGPFQCPTPYKIIKKCLLRYLTQGKLVINSQEIIIKDPATYDKFYILNSKNAGLLYYGQLNARRQKHGFGRLYGKDELYIGDFVGNLKNGIGTQFYANNEHYEGEWNNNMRHGEGAIYYPTNELKQKGTWKMDKMCGMGIFVMENGQVFEGEFQNSVMHGTGILFHENRVPNMEGTWYEGQKQGHFNIFDTQGKLQRKAYFEKDIEINSQEKAFEHGGALAQRTLLQLHQVKQEESKKVSEQVKYDKKTPKFSLQEQQQNREQIQEQLKLKLPLNKPKISDDELRTALSSDKFEASPNIVNFYLSDLKEIHEKDYWLMDEKNQRNIEQYLNNNFKRIFYFMMDEKTKPIGNFNIQTLTNYENIQLQTKKYTGKGFTIFDLYDRIMILLQDPTLQFSQSGWVLAEINCEDDEKLDFIIYDSNKKPIFNKQIIKKNYDCLNDALVKIAEQEIKFRCAEMQDDYSYYSSKIGNAEFLIWPKCEQQEDDNDNLFMLLGYLKDITEQKDQISFSKKDLYNLKIEMKRKLFLQK